MQPYKPYFVAIVIQLLYAFLLILAKLALNDGMNPFVYAFYRQVFGTLLITPIALFLEWRTAPPLSFFTFTKIFVLSLFGMTASIDSISVAVKYTSASIGAACANIVPVSTFVLAVMLRMENLNIRTKSGVMKIVGVILCIGGVAIIAFYTGSYLRLLKHHHLINNSLSKLNGVIPSTKTWIKGVFLMLLFAISWSFWLLFQVQVFKSYPSILMLTSLQCFLSTIQTLIVAVSFERDPSQWKLTWNIRLLSVTYGGLIVSGGTYYLQMWVIEKKGPVFLAMTGPLTLVFTVILSTFLFGVIISLGSTLGAIALVGGLYFVLWGKASEEHSMKEVPQPTIADAEDEC